MKRTSLLTRRKRLNPVSKKRQQRNDDWAPIRDKVLETRPQCEAVAPVLNALATFHLSDVEADRLSAALQGCRGSSTDVHHVVQRSVGGTDAKSNLKALCRRCHSFVHDEIGLAHRLGLLRRSWDG